MNQRMQHEVRLRMDLEAARAERLARWRRGEAPGPFKLMYFPTNACNLDCPICWRRRGVHDLRELSPDRAARLVGEGRELGVRELVIGGGGEPLTRWRRLRPMMDEARAARMYGMLFTNGTLVSEAVARTLVAIGWNKVLVSLDGIGATDVVRGPGVFRRAMRGLDRLVAARAGGLLPVVGVGCVLTSQGARELPALVRLLAERGCDQLNLIRLVVYRVDQRRFRVRPEDLPDAIDKIREAAELAEAAGMVTNLAGYLDREVVSQVERFDEVLLSDRTRVGDDGGFWDALCFEPFSNLVVYAGGEVGPCCMSGDHTMESLAERSMAEVWFGDGFRRLREGVVRRRPAPYCRRCDLNVFQENQRLRAAGRGR